MSEPTEVIAEFSTQAEAEAALAWLRGEGIEASLLGIVNEAVNFPILGGTSLTPTQLVVAVSVAEPARESLSRHAESQLQEGWEDDAEAAVDGWICASCDTPVPLEEAFCPECGAPRSAVRVEDNDDDES